ncbi:MAG: hypothetical protein M3511_04415, partial [Deinococcota bacterium]|nr:hypothetical protein [Deinococcota bacterium]
MLVTPDQVAVCAQALSSMSLDDRETFRLAARCALVCRREDLATFEEVFARFWASMRPSERELVREAAAASQARPAEALSLSSAKRGGEGAPLSLAERVKAYSPGEVLRRKRFEDCSHEELATLQRFILRFSWQPPERRTRRLKPWRKG